jgi:hypothetical protein
MPLSRGDRRWAWLGGAAIAVMLVALGYSGWSRLRDRQVASEAEADVVRALKALPSDHPIILRHGRFLRLEGNGFERSPQGIGRSGIPILLSRQAVFSQTGAKLTITVGRGQGLPVGPFHMYPSEASAAGMTTTIQDGKIWFASGAENTSGSISVSVYHPRCPAK